MLMLRERLEKDMKVLGGLMVIDDLSFPTKRVWYVILVAKFG